MLSEKKYIKNNLNNNNDNDNDISGISKYIDNFVDSMNTIGFQQCIVDGNLELDINALQIYFNIYKYAINELKTINVELNTTNIKTYMKYIYIKYRDNLCMFLNNTTTDKITTNKNNKKTISMLLK
jgi:hypothetical protein